LPNWCRAAVLPSIGANVGFFAYPLADIADRVLAFEPNPDYALFARWMSRDRAEVHEVALSDASGRGTLYVPVSGQGVLLHLAGSLKRSHFRFRNIKTYDVEIRTLDEMGLAGVRFVKADVEGGEREVLDGARATIARDRPIILLELLSGTHDNPAAETAAICETFGYEAFTSAVRRLQHCRLSLPSARIRAGEPTSSRATSYSCRDEGCANRLRPTDLRQRRVERAFSALQRGFGVRCPHLGR
jgi:FkbM family methyltransferase